MIELLVFFSLSATDYCATLGQYENAVTNVELPLKRYTMENGMEVLLLPQPSGQTIAVSTDFDVGSRHEGNTQTGYAHLFEHMLFKGSINAPGNTYQQEMKRLGGQFNAQTFFDYTRYEVQAPRNALSRVLWLEADRFLRPAFDESMVTNQKAAVLEETAMRVDNTPYFRVAMNYIMRQLAHTPYQHDVLGKKADIEGATVTSLRTFHEQHYTPENARMAIVGNFDLTKTSEQLHTAFASWSPLKPPRQHRANTVNDAPVERNTEVIDPRAPWPGLLLAWHTVGTRHPDYPALQLFEHYLMGEIGNPLQHRLRQSNSLLLQQSMPLPMEYHGLSNLVLVPRAHATMESLYPLVTHTISDVVQHSMSEETLCRLKVDWLTQRLNEWQNPLVLANALVAQTRLYSGKPLSKMWLATKRVTVSDINRVANHYYGTPPMRLTMKPSWYMRMTKTLLEWLPDHWSQALEEAVL